MANTDSARGFVAVRHLTGGTIRAREFPIASTYNTGIFKGDPVQQLTDGTISLAGTTSRIVGVFQGVSYVDSAGNQVYSKFWPASTTATDIKASVIADPNVVFMIQEETGGSGALADVGLFSDHSAGTGDTATGMSRVEIDKDTRATAIAQLRILAIHPGTDNAAGEHVNYEVMIYEHELNQHAAAGTPGV